MRKFGKFVALILTAFSLSFALCACKSEAEIQAEKKKEADKELTKLLFGSQESFLSKEEKEAFKKLEDVKSVDERR
jgi:hypothetical protein